MKKISVAVCIFIILVFSLLQAGEPGAYIVSGDRADNGMGVYAFKSDGNLELKQTLFRDKHFMSLLYIAQYKKLYAVRMGNDKNKSALNSYSQAHDAKNVFVVDGGSFVSQADKNPTWTILALSWRTSDYIIQQMNQGNL